MLNTFASIANIPSTLPRVTFLPVTNKYLTGILLNNCKQRSLQLLFWGQVSRDNGFMNIHILKSASERPGILKDLLAMICLGKKKKMSYIYTHFSLVRQKVIEPT